MSTSYSHGIGNGNGSILGMGGEEGGESAAHF